MPHNDWSFIVVELGLVFGGALAFGWWQLRDVAREQAKRETSIKAAAQHTAPQETAAAPASSAPASTGKTPQC